MFFIYLMMCVVIVVAGPIEKNDTVPYSNNGTKFRSRRILSGRLVGETRPYMVYLRAAANAEPKILESNWLCGGVIIHETYILTSAACIEDAKHFLVVSGTHKWYPATDTTNECIKNGAKRAVWKCVPKSYYFDGYEFDNIRWMVADIAVVKVEDAFNFEKRVRGCDFIPRKVEFNNHSIELEKAGNVGSIAGWGTTDGFVDDNSETYLRSSVNSPDLLEADVNLVTKKNCKKRWDPRYHFLIDDNMICTSDTTKDSMSVVCSEQEVNCKELVYDNDSDNEEEVQPPARKMMVLDPSELSVHTAAHIDDTRRTKVIAGGFCENDHGGPLIVGQGKTSTVIGIMSACLTRDITKKCHGPFLFTSVYKYRTLIACAIDKDIGPTCRKLLRTSKTPMVETDFDWPGKEFRPVQRTWSIEGRKKGDTHTPSTTTAQNVTDVTAVVM